MKLRKIFAAVMACSIVCGTQTMPIAYRPIIGITANADVSSVSFDRKTLRSLSFFVVNNTVSSNRCGHNIYDSPKQGVRSIGEALIQGVIFLCRTFSVLKCAFIYAITFAEICYHT